jgi:hypothetical protein
MTALQGWLRTTVLHCRAVVLNCLLCTRFLDQRVFGLKNEKRTSERYLAVPNVASGPIACNRWNVGLVFNVHRDG